MSKISSGILGGFSGKIKGIKGYRRNGKDIIQSNDTKDLAVLSPQMQMRNSMIPKFYEEFNKWNPTQRTRFVLTTNPLYPLPQRLYDQYYPYFPRKSRVPFTSGNVMGIKTDLLNGGQYSHVPGSTKVRCTWDKINQPANMLGSKPCAMLLICFATEFSALFVVPRNTTSGVHEIGFNAANVGFPCMVQCGFISSSSSNPANLTAFPIYWFTG